MPAVKLSAAGRDLLASVADFTTSPHRTPGAGYFALPAEARVAGPLLRAGLIEQQGDAAVFVATEAGIDAACEAAVSAAVA